LLFFPIPQYGLPGCSGGGGEDGGSAGGGNDFGSGFDFGGSYGGGSGGGGGSYTPSLPTTPVVGQLTPPQQQPIDHIAELEKITNVNSNTRAKIDEYRDNLDYLMEEGVEFKANGGMYPAQNNVYNGVKFADVDKYGANPITRIHKHHSELHPIFSFEDIYGMAKFFDQKKQVDPSNTNNITSVMVSKTGLHALRIADPEKAQEFHNYLLSGNYGGLKHFKKLYDKDVVENAYAQCNNCLLSELESWLMDYFIVYFKKLDSGFDYYFAPHLADPAGDYIWVKQN